MTTLRTFRMNGWDLESEELEFFIAVEDDDKKLIGKFAVGEEGICYYRPGTFIMTPNENENTRATYDGYISFEALKNVFEYLLEIGWRRDEHDISVKTEGDRIILALKD